MWDCPEFLLKESKLQSNSKELGSLAVDMKLKPLLNKRIWESDRSLPDRLVTNDLAQMIQLVLEHEYRLWDNVLL